MTEFRKTDQRLRSVSPLLLLVCGLLTLFVLAYQTQKRIEIDLRARSNEKFLDHFYPAEDGARWTEARSAVWLPGLGGGNLSSHVGLRLSGPRLGRSDRPVHVIVRVNRNTLDEFDAPNQERNYEWEIRPWQLGLNGDLLLEIESSTSTAPSGESDFGVRITAIWITRASGIALPSLRGLLLTLTLVGCCAVLLRMSSALGATRAMTIRQFVDPWRNLPAWNLVTIWVAVVAVCAWNKPQGSWFLQTLTFGLLFVMALVWLLARIVSGALTRAGALRVLIVFGLAALVRIPFDFGRGYEDDIADYLALAWKTVGYGIHSAYVGVNGSPPSDNPPLLVYPFWFLGWIYEQLISPLFGRTRLSDPDMLRFMLRLPGLAADLFAGALVFRVLRQRESVSFNSALLAAGAYLFTPALIFDSSYWGQTAAVHALFMLLAVIATDRGSYACAGAALATAILTKPQAIAIAPLVFLFAFRDRALLRCVGAAAGATLVITLPFIVAGNSGAVLLEYANTTRYHPFISVNAHNFWWFVTGGGGWLPDTGAVGPLTFRTAGLLLFACATLLSLVLVWRDQKLLFVVAAYESLAFFMLNTQIHENHSLAMFAPLIIGAALSHTAWWFYCAFALTSVANMTLHDPRLFAWLGYPVNEIYGGPALAGPRWLDSAVQTLLFVAFTVWLATPLAAHLRLKSTRVED